MEPLERLAVMAALIGAVAAGRQCGGPTQPKPQCPATEMIVDQNLPPKPSFIMYTVNDCCYISDTELGAELYRQTTSRPVESDDIPTIEIVVRRFYDRDCDGIPDAFSEEVGGQIDRVGINIRSRSSVHDGYVKRFGKRATRVDC